jgi:hypothetical protein
LLDSISKALTVRPPFLLFTAHWRWLTWLGWLGWLAVIAINRVYQLAASSRCLALCVRTGPGHPHGTGLAGALGERAARGGAAHVGAAKSAAGQCLGESSHTSKFQSNFIVYSTCCIFVANRVSVEDTDVNCAAYMKGCPCTFSTKWHSGAKGTLDSAGRLSAELAAGAVLPP